MKHLNIAHPSKSHLRGIFGVISLFALVAQLVLGQPILAQEATDPGTETNQEIQDPENIEPADQVTEVLEDETLTDETPTDEEQDIKLIVPETSVNPCNIQDYIADAIDLVFCETEETIVVTGNTTNTENTPGWMFNRDPGTDTPFGFTAGNPEIGVGSLYVEPISNTLNTPPQNDKFVGENFINALIDDVSYIKYNFKIGAGGDNADEEQFYMNVYANFGESSPTKFYDCRYDVVPTSGSTGAYTEVVFDPTQAYPVTTRTGGSASPHTCPAVPADMDSLSTGSSNIRAFALNVGDTSTSDQGIDGYLDKVVTKVGNHKTTYDFEPAVEEAPRLHFIKVSCTELGDIAGNENASNADETGGDYTQFSNYNGGTFSPSPLVGGFVHPSEILAAGDSCEREDGWEFSLSTNFEHTNDVSVVGPTTGGEFVTPIYGPGSALNAAQQNAIVNGQLWIKEVEQGGYEFAAIRCYNDALNGDKVEFITLGNDTPDDIYCIAYNIDLGPDLHFYKYVCLDYSDIDGNALGEVYDATGGHFDEFANYSPSNPHFPDPYTTKPVNPSNPGEVSENCHPEEGWQFKLSSDLAQTENILITDPTDVNGEVVLNVGNLPEPLWHAFNNSTLWVSEIMEEGYAFGALRCYTDAINGDNLEVILFNGEPIPDDLYCIAYNVQEKDEPCFETNQIVNGGFEAPVVTDGSGWDVFPDGTYGLGWDVQWGDSTPGTFDGDTLPALANLELHNNVGWSDIEGNQYAELDSDWEGPSGNTGGEPANIEISQTIATQLGTNYNLNFKFSPRPGHSNNVLEVRWNGNLIDTIAADGSANSDTVWSSHDYALAGIAGNSTLEFREVGIGNSFGSFLDDVTLFNECRGQNGEGNSVSGKVYSDTDNEYDHDPGEPGLEGWVVNLYKIVPYDDSEESGAVAFDSTLSDANGDYMFDNLDEGCYIVEEELEPGYVHTQPGEPDSEDYKYYVALGEYIKCSFGEDPTILETITDLFINTADAATNNYVQADEDAIGLDFGNFSADQGGCQSNCSGGGSSGSRSGGSDDETPLVPLVLGDSTGDPQVLGATTLPRTGTPTVTVLALLAILALSGAVGFRILSPTKA